MPDFDVLIIGAGMAGLSAGRLLAATGRRVAILEARARIGGRILTEHVELGSGRSLPIELGAEFIHGLPIDTWNLMHEADLAAPERGGSHICFEDATLAPCGTHFRDSFALLESLADWLRRQPIGTDATFADYLSRMQVPAALAKRAIGYVEGFNAADYKRIGVAALERQQQAECDIDAERIFSLSSGYERLPRFLAAKFQAAGGVLLLEHAVQRVEWQTGSVRLSVQQRGALRSFSARQAILTMPLGVLQARSIEFLPAVHELDANADRLAMGPVLRMSLLFERRFWHERAPGMSFLHSPSLLVPTWWTPEPDSAPLLTAWMAGAAAMVRAAPLLAQGTQVLESAVLGALGQIFDLPAATLRGWLVNSYLHDWQRDEYSRGAYSYAPAGALEASRQLCEPIAGTLFIAGEHTDTQGHWGTVHAAIASGQRAAEQLATE